MLDCIINSRSDLVYFSHGITGHRDSWMHIFLEFAVAKGKRIHLVIGFNDLNKEALYSLQCEFPQALCLHSVENGRKGIASEILQIRSRFPKILVVTGDGEDWLRLIFRLRTHLRVLLMRPYLQKNSPKAIVSYLLKLLYISVIARFPETKVALLAIPMDKPRIFRSYWVDDVPSDYLKFQTDSKISITRLRAEVGIPEGSKIILVPGFITERKNPQLAIAAFKLLQNYNEENHCVLLFAGKAVSETLALFADIKSNGILCVNRYLGKDEYFTLLAESHLVLLLYKNRGSSGVILDAIATETPVLIMGDKRWQNLIDSLPGQVNRASSTPSILRNQIETMLSDTVEIGLKKVHWETRLNVVGFFLDTDI